MLEQIDSRLPIISAPRNRPKIALQYQLGGATRRCENIYLYLDTFIVDQLDAV